MEGGDGLVEVGVADEDGDADLGGGDQLDVDADVTQRLAEVRGDARVGLHARADEGDLADLVVEDDGAELLVCLRALEALEQLDGTRGVLARAGEGDVGEIVVHGRDVLQDHVDVDLGVRQGAEDPRSLTRLVGDAEDSDLGLGTVVGDTGQDCFFHRNILHRAGHDGAGLIAE